MPIMSQGVRQTWLDPECYHTEGGLRTEDWGNLWLLMRQGWGYVKAGWDWDSVEIEVEVDVLVEVEAGLRLRQGWCHGKAAVEVEERPELANRHQSLRSLLHNNTITSNLFPRIFLLKVKSPPQQHRLLKSPPQQHQLLSSQISPKMISWNIFQDPTTRPLVQFLPKVHEFATKQGKWWPQSKIHIYLNSGVLILQTVCI